MNSVHKDLNQSVQIRVKTYNELFLLFVAINDYPYNIWTKIKYLCILQL